MKEENKKQLKWIRTLLGFFMFSLFISGLTAIPIESELTFLRRFFPLGSVMHQWLSRVLNAYREVNEEHPFLLYGYDWLAFAHFILAILFIGPFRNPVRNIWVIEFGLIACVLIFPLALIAGPLRNIPIGWTLIDCAFGVLGIPPLLVCYIKTKRLIKLYTSKQ